MEHQQKNGELNMGDQAKGGNGDKRTSKPPKLDKMKQMVESVKRNSTNIASDSAIEAELRNGATVEQAPQNLEKKREEKLGVKKPKR
jgi:hypothetical protein